MSVSASTPVRSLVDVQVTAAKPWTGSPASVFPHLAFGGSLGTTSDSLPRSRVNLGIALIP